MARKFKPRGKSRLVHGGDVFWSMIAAPTGHDEHDVALLRRLMRIRVFAALTTHRNRIHPLGEAAIKAVVNGSTVKDAAISFGFAQKTMLGHFSKALATLALLKDWTPEFKETLLEIHKQSTWARQKILLRRYNEQRSIESSTRKRIAQSYKAITRGRRAAHIYSNNTPKRKRKRLKYTLGLTNKKITILQLIANGYSQQDVAIELKISKKTVHDHMRWILALLKANNQAQAVAIAMRKGLIG